MDFNQSPLLVIWEVTQACDLACVHCRTEARPERDAGELNTEEARQLLTEVKRFGNPLMVFTGGDPLKRPDIYDLARYSVAAGLRTNITPSATPLLTDEAIDEFQKMRNLAHGHQLGWARCPNARWSCGRSQGTFDQAMAVLRHARDIGLETQVQTTVTRAESRHAGTHRRTGGGSSGQDVESVLSRLRPGARI